MWCGECYTSDPEVKFHVKQKEEFDGKTKSEEDHERVQRAWGNKHHAPDEYLRGRDGDHLLVPFECDLCIFRKLRGQEPWDLSEKDKLLLGCIRRISLDAFWSRAMSKFRTVYSNHQKASPQANSNQHFVQDGCASYWYSRFSIGCKNRMGQDWRPNKALSTALLLRYLRHIQFKVMESETLSEENRWLVLGTYSVLTYVVSLWGSEGFLLDLGGLRQYAVNDKQKPKYFLIPLMGKVKGEYHDRCHLLPSCFLTASGIKLYDWNHKLSDFKQK
jgi:hypothetical protein